jgi:hypothetical protein
MAEAVATVDGRIVTKSELVFGIRRKAEAQATCA